MAHWYVVALAFNCFKHLLTIVAVIAAFWQPISYIINPPSMPPREDLLIRDPKTGVARAKDEYKKGGWGQSEVWYEVWYAVGLIFTFFIFIAAFAWI